VNNLEGLARFVFAESPCPSRKGVIYSRHRPGTQRPSHCCQMLGPPGWFRRQDSGATISSSNGNRREGQRGRAVHRDQQFSKFETYLKDRELSFKRSLSAIDQQGTEGALDRCRVLADQINRDLRDQKPGHFVNSPLLADFQLSLEHAASLLEENTDIHRQSAERPAGLGGDLQPPDPNSGLTAVGSPAAMSREKLFQRAWPRMMIGVMFVLEVVWIVLLVDLSIAFVRFAFLRP
jgi:hypothetical protein